MSSTPRTDQLAQRADRYMHESVVVPASFARMLEHEVVKLRAELLLARTRDSWRIPMQEFTVAMHRATFDTKLGIPLP